MTPQPKYVYDLAAAPASCDFLTWLAIVASHSHEQGNPHFDVAFMPGPNNGFRDDNLEPKDIDVRIALFDNVLVPATRLYPIRTTTIFPEEAEGYCNVPYVAAALKQFEHIPSSRPPEWARKLVREWNPEPPIVLNIRDCGYHDCRNSNRVEWVKVRNELESKYPVVWVDDFGREQTYFNILLRAALYEWAYCTLGVNNGPLILAKLNSNATYILFKPIADTVATSRGWWASNLATPEGSRGYPWAYPNQQICWEEEDTADVILDAFEKLPKEKSGLDYLCGTNNAELKTAHSSR